jgi:hypothetical protein
MLNDQLTSTIRSTSIWQVSAGFLIAGALSAFAVSVVAVYVLGWHDSKFDNALNSALQVALLGMAFSLLVAGVVFVLVLAIRARGQGGFASTWRARVLGAAYPLGIVLLERVLLNFDPESTANFVIASAYLVVYPAAAAFTLKRMR